MFVITGRESQCANLDNSLGDDVQTARKSFRDLARSRCQRNTSDMVPEDFCTQKEALEMVSMEYNYAVVRKPKKNSTPLSTGMSEALGECLPANEDEANSAVSFPLGRSQTDECHVYENVKQGSSKKPMSETSTSSVGTAKTPEENTDETDNKHNYVYAVVDKTKGKKQRDL